MRKCTVCGGEWHGVDEGHFWVLACTKASERVLYSYPQANVQEAKAEAWALAKRIFAEHVCPYGAPV